MSAGNSTPRSSNMLSITFCASMHHSKLFNGLWLLATWLHQVSSKESQAKSSVGQEVTPHRPPNLCERFDNQQDACDQDENCYWFQSACLPDCHVITDLRKCRDEALCRPTDFSDSDMKRLALPPTQLCRYNCMIQPLNVDPTALDCTLCLTESACRRAVTALKAQCQNVYFRGATHLTRVLRNNPTEPGLEERLRHKDVEDTFFCLTKREEDDNFLTEDALKLITQWTSVEELLKENRAVLNRDRLESEKGCQLPQRAHLKAIASFIGPGEKIQVSCEDGYELTGSSRPEMECDAHSAQLNRGAGIRCISKNHM